MSGSRLKEIVRPFGVRIGRIRSYASLYKSDAAFRVTTDTGEMAVKPFNRRKSGTTLTAVQQVKRVSANIRRLEAAGYAHMPQWRRTRSGRYWLRHGGKIYYMTEWVHGRRMSADLNDYAALGRSLARLHVIRPAHGGTGTRGDTSRFLSSCKRSQRLFRRRLTRLRTIRTQAGRWFRAHGPECLRLSGQAWKLTGSRKIRAILAAEPKRPALIHGDVTVPNIVVGGDGVKLIDWDSLRGGSIYCELAKTLANTTGFRPDRMEALLHGYEEIRPLRQPERVLVAALFRFPREAWSAAHALAGGRTSRVFSVLRSTWRDRKAAARWLKTWGGMH